MWIAETERERHIIADLNAANKEIEELRVLIARQKHRIKQLEGAVRSHPPVQTYPRNDLVDPPPQRGRVLQPGEPGYITYIRTTAQGRKLVKAAQDGDSVQATNADLYILVLGTQDKMTFDKIVETTPTVLADKRVLIRNAKLLNKRALIEIDFEKTS